MLFEYKAQANTRGVDISVFSVDPQEEYRCAPLILSTPQLEPGRMDRATVCKVVTQMR